MKRYSVIIIVTAYNEYKYDALSKRLMILDFINKMDNYRKYLNDCISKTITAHMKFDCNMYIHPTQARGLTPREAARIQSYPDDYFFRGAYTKTYMQIGNSVPPLLGRAIAKIIKQYLRGE